MPHTGGYVFGRFYLFVVCLSVSQQHDLECNERICMQLLPEMGGAGFLLE